MSAQCQACSAKATLFLCNVHIREMRTMLDELVTGPDDHGLPRAGLLEHLTDAALGRAKLSSGGRAGAKREPFKGDDDVFIRCKCGHSEHNDRPCEAVDREVIGHEVIEGMEGLTRPVIVERPCPCGEYRPAADQARLRAQLLAVGRVNTRAADLLDEITNTLSTCVRDICEARRTRFIPVCSVEPGFVGPLRPGWRRLRSGYTATPQDLAQWLAAHVMAVASSEGAGECFVGIRKAIEDIERVINRPVQFELLGFCATEVNDKPCDAPLRAPEDAIEVRCVKCHTVRRCDMVRRMSQNQARREPITWQQVLNANKLQPEGWRVNERTLRHWRATGALRAHRWREDGEPLYKWDDIEQLRSKVPARERKRTRAGA